MKQTGIILGIAALALIIAGCATAEQSRIKPLSTETETPKSENQKPIKIGWLGPLTGDLSSVGQAQLNASEMAVEEINAEGGIGGRKIELLAEDGKCNPKDGVLAGNKLINIDKVPVIVGGLCSGETIASSPIAEENKVVLISTCSSAPPITNAGDYIFRTFPSDAFQGKFAAEYVYTKMGKRKAAVLAVLSDWGIGIKNTFSKEFEKLGGEIVFAEDHTADTRDLRSALTKIKSSDADLLYFVSHTEASIAGLKQAKDIGLTLPIFGADGWGDVAIHKSAAAEGIKFTIPASDFEEEWKKKLSARGTEIMLCTANGYDNVKIIADIMRKVGTNSTDIKNALYKVSNYPGISGSISFDENGDLTSAEYEVQEVKNGKAELVD